MHQSAHGPDSLEFAIHGSERYLQADVRFQNERLVVVEAFRMG